jgi:hypothetical protein
MLDVAGVEAVNVEYDEAEAAQQAGPVLPVEQLEAVRHGAQLHARWVWPDDVRLAEVVWDGPDGRSAWQITRARHLDAGCISPTLQGSGQLTVTSLRVTAGGEVLRAVGRSTSFAGEPLTLKYSVRRTGGLLRPSYVVRVTPNLPCADIRLRARISVLGAPGLDQIIGTVDAVTSGPTRPYELAVRLPRGNARTRRRRFVHCEAWDRHGDPILVDDDHSVSWDLL